MDWQTAASWMSPSGVIVVAFAVFQVLRLWFTSELFQRPREWARTRAEVGGSPLAKLLACPLCLGVHLTVLMLITAWLSGLGPVWQAVLGTGLTLLAASGAATLLYEVYASLKE